MGSSLLPSAHMTAMITLTLMTATAIVAALATDYVASRREHEDALGYGALAPAWREGYLAGVSDERTSAAWDVPGYGPNRCNPYPGPEQAVQYA